MRPFRRYLVIVLLITAVVSGGRAAWNETLKLGCLPAGGVKPAASWLDNCDSDRIGDYAHSAVWFGTEPSIKAALLKARVFFFGDSRMLDAMSEFAPGIASNPAVLADSTSVSRWFAAQGVPYYILAFNYGEQSGWAEKLFAKIQPRPAVLVFDSAPYFTGGESLPAEAIAANPAAEMQTALATQAFLQQAPGICGYLAWLCGRTASNYRSEQDGHVFQPAPERIWFGRRTVGHFPITAPPPGDTSHYDDYLRHARTLLAAAGVEPRCAVFTVIPNSDIDDRLAHFLADRLGGTVISPRLDGLASVDHWHLTLPSAQAWTAAFLEELGPVIKGCTAGS